MRDARDADHAARRAGLEGVEQQLGEQEVAEVVHGELRLVAVLGLAFGGVHDAGVVDQSIEAFVLRLERHREAADGGQAREVELHGLDRARVVVEVGGRLFAGLDATARRDDVRALLHELLGGGEAGAGVGARHDVRGAGEVFGEQLRVAHEGLGHLGASLLAREPQ